MSKHLTPTQSARAYLIRQFGPFVVAMSPTAQRQIERAYIAGVRHGRNGGKRNGR